MLPGSGILSPRDARSSEVEIPNSFDWTNYAGYDWTTPCKSFGFCSICSIASAVGVIESVLKIRSGDPYYNPDLSEQEILSCLESVDCYGGSAGNNLWHIRDNGIGFEQDFPYESHWGIIPECKSVDSSKKRVFIDYGVIVSSAEWINLAKKTELTKMAIMQKGPLVLRIEEKPEKDIDDIYRCNIQSEYAPHYCNVVGWNWTGDFSDSYWVMKDPTGDLEWQNDGVFKLGMDAIDKAGDYCMHCYGFADSPFYVEIKEGEVGCNFGTLEDGWNLVSFSGESENVVDVAQKYQDGKIISVWEWERKEGNKGNWSFFSPNLSDNGKSYAGSKGFGFLETVREGPGYWVNYQDEGLLKKVFRDEPTGSKENYNLKNYIDQKFGLFD
jgi:hypothetical protein